MRFDEKDVPRRFREWAPHTLQPHQRGFSGLAPETGPCVCLRHWWSPNIDVLLAVSPRRVWGNSDPGKFLNPRAVLFIVVLRRRFMTILFPGDSARQYRVQTNSIIAKPCPLYRIVRHPRGQQAPKTVGMVEMAAMAKFVKDHVSLHRPWRHNQAPA